MQIGCGGVVVVRSRVLLQIKGVRKLIEIWQKLIRTVSSLPHQQFKIQPLSVIQNKGGVVVEVNDQFLLQ